jgi:two-component system response regulator PilR (NtrC family)
MSSRILIVDDEEEIRNSLQRKFQLQGYEVAVAANGIDACLELERNAYQVVISDIRMPGKNGVDLLRYIKREYPMTRVIMITGYVTLDNALACMRHGADTCIFKPFKDMDELDAAVTSALAYLDHWEKKLHDLRAMKPLGEVR